MRVLSIERDLDPNSGLLLPDQVEIGTLVAWWKRGCRVRSFLKSLARRPYVLGRPYLESETRATRITFSASLIAHSALLAVMLGTVSLKVPLPDLIPVSVMTAPRPDSLGSEVSPFLEAASKLAGSRNTPSFAQVDDAQRLVVAKLPEAFRGSEPGVPGMRRPRTDDRDDLPPQKVARSERSHAVAAGMPSAGDETQLRNAAGADPAQGGGIVGWVAQKGDKPPDLTVTSRSDWEIDSARFSKVEEKVYAAPDSGVRLTVREAASAGFAGTDFTRGVGLSSFETSGPLGLSPTDGIARSQKIDWTFIDLKDFGVTAFGYQSEVGRNFEPFERTKKEFETAGTRKMKAGANVRVGAFDFGLSQSSIEKTYGSPAGTVQSEASASVDLPRLLRAAQVTGDLVPKLIPTVWMNASTSQIPMSGQADDTVTMSFGGTWSWDMGNASLGYWSSSFGNNANLGATWSGQGFDANVGAYYGAFAVDLGLSYGQSEDAALSWESAGDLYNSSVTVSYKPDKLPGISVTAAVGNYDQNSMAFGSTFSESYAWSSNSHYISLSAGLDLTSLFWSSEGSGEGSSVKMLYRHSESVFFDSYSDATSDIDDLVAVTVQRKF